MDIAISKNGVPIRMTTERWQHITIGHPDLADYYYEILETIENPEIIFEGSYDAKIAIKKFQERDSKFVIVVYKEINASDGFGVTAYFSTKIQEFKNKKLLWKYQN
ncbi:MAG: hypothetical protein A2046_02230 [Bacteroidetes bacterium GWA2_30_7]|nr:MAG: hypothetical protein A2046_02230 [Bacteroidetes bacterium GWA2_30_7]